MAPSLHTSDNLLICCGCGAQYDVDESGGLSECRICEDPRQYVPPTGQKFTTLAKLRSEGHRNVFTQNAKDPNVWEMQTEPKFGIGQRACLITTPHGNILWDIVAFLDQATIDKIEELGRLKFIVISHPHFYTTWADWSSTFKCPVYIAHEDSQWLNRQDCPTADLRLRTEQVTEFWPGLKAVTCGGHFEGSSVLNSLPPNTTIPTLFAADTIFSVASSHNPVPGKPGVLTYQFLWSIPNMIPLPPDTVMQIWKAVKRLDFKATYGVMQGFTNIYEEPEHRVSLKQRLLDSAKIAVKAMGYTDHPVLAEQIE